MRGISLVRGLGRHGRERGRPIGLFSRRDKGVVAGVGGRGVVNEVRWDESGGRGLSARLEIVAGWIYSMRTSVQEGDFNSAIVSFLKAVSYVGEGDVVNLSRALRSAGRAKDAVEVFREVEVAKRTELVGDEEMNREYALALASALNLDRAMELSGGSESVLVAVALEIARSTEPELVFEMLKKYDLFAIRLVGIAGLICGGKPQLASSMLQEWLNSGESAAADINLCAGQLLITAAVEGKCVAAQQLLVNESLEEEERTGVTATDEELYKLAKVFAEHKGAKLLFYLLWTTKMDLLPRFADGGVNGSKQEFVTTLCRLANGVIVDRTIEGAAYLSKGIFILDINDLNAIVRSFCDSTVKGDSSLRVDDAMKTAKILTNANESLKMTVETYDYLFFLCKKEATRWSKCGSRSRALFAQMRAENLTPSSKGAFDGLEAMSKSGHYAAAIQVMEMSRRGREGEMRFPVKAYESVLYAAAIAGQDTLCANLVKKMVELKVPLSKQIFEAMIISEAKHGRIAAAEDILDHMIATDSPTNPLAPGIQTFAKLFMAVGVGKFRKVPDLLKKYADTIAALRSPIVYNVIMEVGVLRATEPIVADAFRRMKEAKITGNAGTITQLACIRIVYRDLEGAKGWLQFAERKGFLISERKRQDLIAAFARTRLFDESFELALFQSDEPLPRRHFVGPVGIERVDAFAALIRACIKSVRGSPKPNEQYSRYNAFHKYQRNPPERSRPSLECAVKALAEIQRISGRPATSYLREKVIAACLYSCNADLADRVTDSVRKSRRF